MKIILTELTVFASSFSYLSAVLAAAPNQVETRCAVVFSDT